MLKEIKIKPIKVNYQKFDSFLIDLKEQVSNVLEYYTKLGLEITKQNQDEFDRIVLKSRKKLMDMYFEFLNDSYSNIIYKRKDFMDDLNYLDDVLLPKVSKRLWESLPNITLDNEILSWNNNKTEDEWKKRITARTKLSYESFYKLIQLGLNKASSQVCASGDTCIIFQKSQFILIINKKDKRIISIRDTKWDKPIGDKPCKRAIVFESDEHATDIIDNVFFNCMDFEGYSLQLTEDIHTLIIESKCKCCVEVNL